MGKVQRDVNNSRRPADDGTQGDAGHAIHHCISCYISLISATTMKSVLAFWLLCGVGATEVLRPRGVVLSKASFYDPKRDFTCLDGSGTISFSYVNDDYCDCQDGSDEPGTAACPNGFFHCTNAGHTPLNIPSSRVNDGVCDCCDASDEYASSASCVDTCRELGKAAREEAAKQREERLKGYQLRQSMIEEGRKTRKEAEKKIEELKKEKGDAESTRLEKEEIKKTAEEPEKLALEKYLDAEAEKKAKAEEEEKKKDEAEAREAFAHLDNNGDGFLTIEELQSRQTFDTNRDGQVSQEEAKFYLGQEDSMSKDTFLNSGWLMMRPIYTMDKGMFTPPSSTPSPPEKTLAPPPPVFDEDNYQTEEEEEPEDFDSNLDPEDDSEDDDSEEYDPPEDEHEDVGKEGEQKEEEEEPKYDEETQKLVDVANAAREEFDEADRRVRDLARELRTLEESQEKDYGPEDEFRVLEGNCFEYTDREYTYRLCPFDKAIQKPKSGHGETRLGQWGEWSGPEENKYSRMLYNNGQACWNGPTRSADVHISCGTETKLMGVSEPNRCEYLFLLSSPAVCTKPEDVNGDENTDHSHIEL
ncbi:glucosidase 2 subunit beta isoform X2 [Procambarus clarkii]|uniref:glucosidase 2 subunit beta isoform X2 n=1 Tax=Procambarus clarkii TaxID=6728 RepID=UPI001E678A0F|nr:glucosidase 2 subunit beta-like [Procambarus clarkii]